MEQKLVKVPFEVELAKRIQNKECEGRIVTCDGRDVRIVCWDRKCFDYPIVALIDNIDNEEGLGFFTKDGETRYCNDAVKLILEIPEYMTFKDGDLVVTDNVIVVIRNPKMDDLNGFCFRLYVAYNCKENNLFYCADFINQEKKVRFSTEEEKQSLIDALKASKDQRAKEYLKRFFGIE